MLQRHGAGLLVTGSCAPGPGYRTHGLMTAKAGGQPEAGGPRKQNDKPCGRPVLGRAPCLLQGLCITHELNAHFPPLPLFFSCSDFSHVYLLVSVRVQLVFLPLKETGRHTWGCGGDQRDFHLGIRTAAALTGSLTAQQSFLRDKRLLLLFLFS